MRSTNATRVRHGGAARSQRDRFDDASRRHSRGAGVSRGPAAAEFFCPTGKFAATTFDALPDNPPHRFAAGDVLAVTLLDVAVEPRALQELLDTRSAEFDELLRDMPTDLDLWATTDTHLAAVDRFETALRDPTRGR